MGRAGRRGAFGRGFRAMVPLWLGVVPFAIAYSVLAREAGLSVLQTQSLSIFVFAGSAQASAVGLFATGAAGITIVLTTLLLNVRHVLYGLTLGGRMSLAPHERPAAAYFLTDEAFGVVIAQPDRSFAYLLGAELSLFATWNLSTFAGAVLGGAIPDPEQLGVDFVFPLAFLALLGPLLRGRIELVVALVSGVLAFGATRVLPAGLPILVTGIAGSLLGAWLARGTDVEPERDLRDLAREVA